MPINIKTLSDMLSGHGLDVFGSFHTEDVQPNMHFQGKIGVLVGNAGPSMWRVFFRSPEMQDGKPDPLDRWTRRVLGGVCSDTLAKEQFFPFDKPFLPFQKFMQLATGARQSPLGLYIHPEYGFWYGLRGLLVYDDGLLPADTVTSDHPCDACATKPCLSACPVDAFNGITLNADACRNFLDGHPKADCHSKGCGARNSCPVGIQYAYPENQIRFHMKAYSRAKAG